MFMPFSSGLNGLNGFLFLIGDMSQALNIISISTKMDNLFP